MSEARWWTINACWENVEENSYLLFELDIRGLVILDNNNFECFFTGNSDSLDILKNQISELGITINSSCMVEDRNWLQKCEEIWQPVDIKNIRITPIIDIDSTALSNNRQNEIYIIPGEGFGTGHHDTTKNIIEILQSLESTDINPKSALDVGCGSGILALSIEKLFSIDILALDNDPVAIANARDNLKINNSTHIQLSTEELSKIQGKYGLIVANIYAEVLLSMRADFARLISTGGYLVLSGIMSGLSEDLISEFKLNSWELIRHSMSSESDKGEWIALLFRYSTAQI